MHNIVMLKLCDGESPHLQACVRLYLSLQLPDFWLKKIKKKDIPSGTVTKANIARKHTRTHDMLPQPAHNVY
jgi:hypothetical protein